MVKLVCSLLWMMALIIPQLAAAQSAATLAGATPGEFKVGSLGQATYSLPIQTPPGRAGVEANLSLEYNSLAENSYFGMGWNLAGVSQITRCSQTIAQDNFKNPVVYDNTKDRFCLDGQRLVVTSGAYGANGSEYATEIDSGIRIRFINGTFDAFAQDGSYMVFGGGSYNATVQSTLSSGTTRAWALNVIQDRNGNQVRFEYSQDVTTKEHYISKIQYTFNGATPAKNAVEFIYETRPDEEVKYIGGDKIVVSQRVNRIETKHDGSLVKAYHFQYDESPLTKRSRLIDVQECGPNNACLEPVRLGWKTGNAGMASQDATPLFGNLTHASLSTVNAKLISGDFNGDGLTDIFYQYSGPSGAGILSRVYLANDDLTFTSVTDIIPGQTEFQVHGVFTNLFAGDFNGDGFTDILRQRKAQSHQAGDTGATVFLSDGDGTFTEGPALPLLSVQYIDNLYDNEVVLMDINGDGLMDIITTTTSSSTDMRVLQSNGDGSFYRFLMNPGTVFDHDHVNILPGDFNGDGRTDFIRQEKGALDNDSSNTAIVYLSRGNYPQGTNLSYVAVPNFVSNPDSFKGDFTDIIPGDFNGDGMTDILRREKENWATDNSGSAQLYLSRGDGTFEEVPNFIPDPNDLKGTHDNHPGNDIILADFNGDSIMDFIRRDRSNGAGNLQLYYGTATGVFHVVAGGTYLFDGIGIPGDYNGDGATDFIYQAISASVTLGGADMWVGEASSPTDMVATIENGIGATVSIDYSPLTDSSVYIKSSSAIQPQRAVTIPISVVSSFSISNGGIGHQYDYRYFGLFHDRLRGGMVFRLVTEIDHSQLKRKETEYSIMFPTRGNVQFITTYSTPTNAMEQSSFYGYDSTNAAPYQNVPIAQSTTYFNDDGSEHATIRFDYTYDALGRMTQLHQRGDISDPNDDVYICRAYYSGGSTGFLDSWKQHFVVAGKTVSNSLGCNNLSSWNASYDLNFLQKTYDAKMNILSQKSWDNVKNKWITTQATYDVYGNILTMTNPSGNVTSLTYDAQNHTYPITMTSADPDGGGPLTSIVHQYEHDARFGVETKHIDPNGNIVSQTTLDALGRVIQEQGTHPDNSTLTTIRRTFYENDPAGGVLVNSWQALNWDDNDLSAWNGEPTDRPWSIESYDAFGNHAWLRTVGYDNNTVVLKQMEYNGNGKLVSVTKPFYDTAGCIHYAYGESCSQKNFSNFYYDARGRLNSIVETINSEVVNSIFYSHPANDISKTNVTLPNPGDLTSGNSSIVWTQDLTPLGREEEKATPDGSQVDYTYDLMGRIIAVNDPLGELATVTYNSLGQITQENKKTVGIVTYTYTDNGQIETKIDANNQKILFAYDNVGRLISKKLFAHKNDATPREAFIYEYDDVSKANGKGQLTQIITDHITYEFAYDNRGQIKERKSLIDIDGSGSIDQTEETLIEQMTYNVHGKQQEYTYPDGSILRNTYRPDLSLEKTGLKEPNDGMFTEYASYDPPSIEGSITGIRYGNGVTSTNTFDQSGNISRLNVQKGAQAYNDFQYTWNRAGKLLEIQDMTANNLGRKFSDASVAFYDTQGRINRAGFQNSSGGYDYLDYSFNAADNLTQKGPLTYNYNNTNNRHRLTNLENADTGEIIDLSYDNVGNVTRKKKVLLNEGAGPQTLPGANLEKSIPSHQLQLWLKPENYNQNTGVWSDASGEGNFASQATASKRPVYVASGTNGQPVVRFDGVDDGLVISDNVNLQGNYTVFIVDAYLSGGAKGRTLQSRDVNWLVGRWSGQSGMFAGTWVHYEAAPENTLELHMASRTTNIMSISSYSLNGSGGGGMTGGNSPGRLGLVSEGAAPLEVSKADIAEVIVYDRDLNADEIQQVECYLKHRYNLSLVTGCGHKDPVLHLKANDYNASTGVWTDTSGHGSHATQGTATKRPTQVANGPGGQPTVRFDGVDDGMVISDNLNLQRPYTVFLVDAYVAGGPQGRTLQSRDINWLVGRYYGGVGHYSYNNWIHFGAYPAESLGLHVATGDASTSTYYLNGSHKDTAAVIGNPGRLKLAIGNGVNIENSKADISEVIVYDRILTEEERQKVECELASRYNIPLDASVRCSDAQMVLWLKANNYDPVFGIWNDVSGQGNHATQSNAGKRPTFVETGTNGKPAVRFDGVDDGLAIADNLSLERPYTAFIVDSYVSGGTQGRTLQSRDINWLLGRWSGQFGHFANGWVHYEASSVDSLGVHVATGDNTENVYYYNGERKNSVLTTGHPGRLGLVSEGAAPLEVSTADIAEVIIFKGVLSDADRQEVECYLANRYDITLDASISCPHISVKDFAYTYDEDNRLTQVTKNGTTTHTHAYDHTYMRVKSVNYDEAGDVELESFYPMPMYSITRQPDGTQVHTKAVAGPAGLIATVSRNKTTSVSGWIASNTYKQEANMSNPLGSPVGFSNYWMATLSGTLHSAFMSEQVAFRATLLVFALLLGTIVFGVFRSEEFSYVLLGRASMAGVMCFALLLHGTAYAQGPVAGSNGAGIPEVNTILYHHSDHLGNVITVTDDTGNVQSRTDYDLYGGIRTESSSGTDNFRGKFTGKEFDTDSELYYFGMRYYDPEIGRFLTPDPLRQYHGLYNYGPGDPLTGTDPTGGSWEVLANFYEHDLPNFFKEYGPAIATGLVLSLIILVGIVLLFVPGAAPLGLAMIGLGVGAYLGGATANNSWDMTQWDFSNPDTYIGMAIGGAIGFVLGGVGGLVAMKAFAVGGAIGWGTGIGMVAGAGAGVWGAGDAVGWKSDPRSVSYMIMGGAVGGVLGGIFGGLSAGAMAGATTSASSAVYGISMAGFLTGVEGAAMSAFIAAMKNNFSSGEGVAEAALIGFAVGVAVGVLGAVAARSIGKGAAKGAQSLSKRSSVSMAKAAPQRQVYANGQMFQLPEPAIRPVAPTPLRTMMYYHVKSAGLRNAGRLIPFTKKASSKQIKKAKNHDWSSIHYRGMGNRGMDMSQVAY